jgi:hypothetical protein
MKQSAFRAQAIVHEPAIRLQISPAKGQCVSTRHSTHSFEGGAQMVRNGPGQSLLLKQLTQRPEATSQWDGDDWGHSESVVHPRHVDVAPSQTGFGAGHVRLGPQVAGTLRMTLATRSPHVAAAAAKTQTSTEVRVARVNGVAARMTFRATLPLLTSTNRARSRSRRTARDAPTGPPDARRSARPAEARSRLRRGPHGEPASR